MSTSDAFVAVTRFGLGARAGELKAAAGDPRGWLLDQIIGPAPLPSELRGLPTAKDTVAGYLRARQQGRDLARLFRKDFRDIYIEEAGARSLAALNTTKPFHERLVQFWSNHFTVSVKKPIVLGIAGAYEREAIRPHVTGRFADMLLAVARHPAMLLYLDNAQSIGPNSRYGKRADKGLNENLAREILELHSLGVDGGYGQNDVTALAKILTGWSLARPQKDADPGGFKFHPLGHEPGDKTLLGKRYAERGIEEGEAALRDLARHPATARHVATKLARHFIADDPPAAAVARLTKLFLDSDGDLAAITRALVESPEPWQTPLSKIKTPQDYITSILRMTGYNRKPRHLIEGLRLLGQAPWTAPSPAGWSDEGTAWASPDGLIKRVELAGLVAKRAGNRLDPRQLIARSIGPVISEQTSFAVTRAPSARDGLALLLASTEFQRR